MVTNSLWRYFALEVVDDKANVERDDIDFQDFIPSFCQLFHPWSSTHPQLRNNNECIHL